MDWLELTIHTTTMGADLVSDVLMNAGAEGTQVEDRYDVLSSRKEDGMWDMIDEDVLSHMAEDVLVKAFFPMTSNAAELLPGLSEKMKELLSMQLGFDIGSLNIDTEQVKDEDWAENWKKYYKPMKAGKRLVIKPSWEKYDAAPSDLVIEIDPGMAFGTGSHETTSMCLATLEDVITPGCTCIDVGTGSGILGLAAAKLGASDVLAIDLDADAVKTAKENVIKNGLADTVRVVHGDLLEKQDEVADVIVANIIADVICYLAGPVRSHLKKNGTFICSGILDSREEDVMNALTVHGYTLRKRIQKGDWVCLVAGLE